MHSPTLHDIFPICITYISNIAFEIDQPTVFNNKNFTPSSHPPPKKILLTHGLHSTLFFRQLKLKPAKGIHFELNVKLNLLKRVMQRKMKRNVLLNPSSRQIHATLAHHDSIHF